MRAALGPLAAPLLVALAGGPAAAQGAAAQGLAARGVATPADTGSYVAWRASAGRFPLAASGRPAPLFVSGDDWPGVIRAVGDLRADLQRVTGDAPAVRSDSVAGGAVVVVGTIGHSSAIDRLVRAGRIDTAGVAGRWEAYLLQVVADPAPGVRQALVIAGSDRRGTIYGVYDLSQRIGVSPWYWWADVPVRHRADVYILPGRHFSSGPAVKYRGIFINDEAPAFSGWARERYGGINHRPYERVFELLLRLKANYLWPAMWGNAFADDDTLSPALAEEYGIVMGTSHHEPMTRAQQEWKRYGHGPWNYSTNDSTLRAFWRAGIERMVRGGRENVVTIGMRGDGDMPMTQGTAIALLERIVADQRRIIADVTGRDAAATPQLWALYKEVQDYYDQGMRVPDDVTLLFADDNWGNIRRLPRAEDRARAGGFGVYYHFDYVGGPRNYKWINTNQIARVWEQMHLAHALGADRIWIVNVGDLKPMALPIQFFLDYAWDPASITADGLPAYTRAWVARQFPTLTAAQAAEVADIVAATGTYLSRRKPELLDTATFSLTSFDEAARVNAAWQTLAARARRLGSALPPAARDAYYELVLHPVLAGANLQALYYAAARNHRDARQGRAATNALADSVRLLFERDATIGRYYNDTLAGGKWRHMMDQTHIGYTYWQEPPHNTMPRVDVIQLPVAASMGVDVVEQNRAGPPAGAPRFAGPPRAMSLPTFDPFQRQAWHVDVYDRGQTPFTFRAAAAEPWVTVEPASGTVSTERRLTVTVDWAHAPAGTRRVPITITASDGSRAVVEAPIFDPPLPRRDGVAGFVEGNGYVAMEAEHYSRAIGGGAASWLRIPEFGRTLSGVTIMPVTAPAQQPGPDGARLEYDVFLFDSGTVTVHAYVSPSHAFLGKHLRYAVSFDDEPPQVVDIHADGSSNGTTDGNRAWEQSVANDIKVLTSTHTIAHPGAHVLRYWAVDPGVVLQRLVVAADSLSESYLGPPESYRGGAPHDGGAATHRR